MPWHTILRTQATSEKYEAFVAEIQSVCERHKMTISHEDGHGAFIVESDPDFPTGIDGAHIGSIIGDEIVIARS